MNFFKPTMTEDEVPPSASAVEEPGSPTDLGARRDSDSDGPAGEPVPDNGIKWSKSMLDHGEGSPPRIPLTQRERRMSKEWDASKVPPSRFQKREGSITATPNSRDGHIDKNKLKAFADKYINKNQRRKSSA